MEIKKNPDRDYRSVERGNITMLCIPSGMQPVFCDSEAFLRNAGVTREIPFFYRAIFPNGNSEIYNIEIKCFMAYSPVQRRLQPIVIKLCEPVILTR